MVGAHLDSVLEGPGINDNGSGVAAVLEIARGVAEGGIPEAPPFGSASGVGRSSARRLARLRAEPRGRPGGILNIDMAGSLNGANFVYHEVAVAERSGAITQGYVEWLTERGEVRSRSISMAPATTARSRRRAFRPAACSPARPRRVRPRIPRRRGRARPADACYHRSCDDLDNVDVERVALFADATLAIALGLIGD